MSSKKAKRTRARERVRLEQERQAQEREQQQRKSRRTRIIALTAAGLAVVLIAVILGVAAQQRRSADEGPAPRGAVAGGLAIPVGQPDAPVTLTVFEDFRCPACKGFEDRYGATIGDLVDSGDLRVEYRIATIIDSLGSSGSKVAGNAAACAQDAGRFREYHDRLFDHQPEEKVDGFTEERVIELAEPVAGLDTARFRACVEDERYRPWLKRVQTDFDDRYDRLVTPTVLLDGTMAFGGTPDEPVDTLKNPANLKRTVQEKAGA
ncbi:MAG: thioredoxin domain-containing protein [Streptosporangiales bacterium]|nr:thioredoxin domain-containing protein [Streptosporangiales bacterium]